MALEAGLRRHALCAGHFVLLAELSPTSSKTAYVLRNFYGNSILKELQEITAAPEKITADCWKCFLRQIEEEYREDLVEE